MRSQQELYTEPHYLKGKEISIDKYDTDSDEEDHRREEEEIKGIINRARIKGNRPRPLNSHTSPTEILASNLSNPKLITSPKSEKGPAMRSPKGFFPTTLEALDATDKKEGQEDVKKISNLKSKRGVKINQKKGLFDLEANFLAAEEPRDIFAKSPTGFKTTKLPVITSTPINQEFHKESFQSLLSLYSKATTSNPVKLFMDKNLLPRAMNRLGLEDEINTQQKPHPSFRSDFVHYDDMNGGRSSKVEKGDKKLKDIIPDLIAAMLLDSYEPLDKKSPGEIPRFKNIDWAEITKRTGAKKFELLIIDPINFTIEDCIEITSENPTDIKNAMHEAIKEINPSLNEAKHILVYLHEEGTGNRKLFFHKFFFFLKNHKPYEKNLKSEKEVITYYMFVLALLELRITYENNPFKDDKIQTSQKKAYNILKKTESLPSYVSDWFIKKVQPMIAIEKAYINLNVGGKADSNFTFSMHEQLVYSYPKFAQLLHGPKGKVNKDNLPSDRERPKHLQEQEGYALPLQRDSANNFRTSHKSSVSPKKAELTLNVVDYMNQGGKEEPGHTSGRSLHSKRYASHANLPSIITPTSADPHPPIAQSFMASTCKDSVNGGLAPKRLGVKNETGGLKVFVKNLSSPVGDVIVKPEPKIYLASPRMNTTYSQLLKQRHGKTIDWRNKF